MKLYIKPEQLEEFKLNKESESMVAIEVNFYKKCKTCEVDYIGDNKQMCSTCENKFRVLY